MLEVTSHASGSVLHNRGLTEENAKLGIISPIGYFKFPIGDIYPIGDMFSDSALPNSYIHNSKLDILSPIGDLRYIISTKLLMQQIYFFSFLLSGPIA